MAGNLQPLYRDRAVVNPDGTPTEYFIRWAQDRQIDITDAITLEILEEYLADHPLIAGSGIDLSPSGNIADNVTIEAKVQEILDQISTTRGTILYRGASAWAALAPGTAGQVLQTGGAGADPSWVSGRSFSGAKIYKATSISVTTGATTVISSWDTEDYDIGGWWSSGVADSFVIPSGVGKVNVNFNMFRAASVADQFIAQIALFDSSNALLGTVAVNEIDTAGGDSVSVSAIGINVTAGMRVKARYFVTNAGSLDGGLYGTTFSIQATG